MEPFWPHIHKLTTKPVACTFGNNVDSPSVIIFNCQLKIQSSWKREPNSQLPIYYDQDVQVKHLFLSKLLLTMIFFIIINSHLGQLFIL